MSGNNKGFPEGVNIYREETFKVEPASKVADFAAEIFDDISQGGDHITIMASVMIYNLEGIEQGGYTMSLGMDSISKESFVVDFQMQFFMDAKMLTPTGMKVYHYHVQGLTKSFDGYFDIGDVPAEQQMQEFLKGVN